MNLSNFMYLLKVRALASSKGETMANLDSEMTTIQIAYTIQAINELTAE